MLMLALWPKIWSILVKVPIHFGKNVYPVLVNGTVQFFCIVVDFCLAVLYNAKRGVKVPNFNCELTYFSFNSVNSHFVLFCSSVVWWMYIYCYVFSWPGTFIRCNVPLCSWQFSLVLKPTTTLVFFSVCKVYIYIFSFFYLLIPLHLKWIYFLLLFLEWEREQMNGR